MMIAKGLALVSVLWNLAGNSDAPFLTPAPSAAALAAVDKPRAERDPAAPPIVAASPVVAPSPAASAAPAVAAVVPEMPDVPAAPAPAPAPAGPLGPQKGPVLTAVHVTGWVMQLPVRLAALIEAAKKGGMTAMIFEVKDVNGDLFFKMETGDGTNRFAEAIKACHAANLKVIARYCVFKDKLAEEKNLAMRYGTLPGTNSRHKPWTNPQAKATQDYNLGLIKELVAMGVDEVNLDYIRFPSAPEGVHIDLPLPTKCKAIADFVRRVRAIVPKPTRLSMDVFGYVAWDENSARVGQRLEDLAPHVDGIYPMLYPDHFAKGDLGYKHPVEHPYEVMRRGCEAARSKRGMEKVDVIPWLQAFSLSSDAITYGPVELLAQIQGARDAGVPSWLAWNPRVNYTDLDRALAMGKGKSSYTSIVKKYIPAKYLAAATPAADDVAPPVAAPTTARPSVAAQAPAAPPAAGQAASVASVAGPVAARDAAAGTDAARPAPPARTSQPVATNPAVPAAQPVVASAGAPQPVVAAVAPPAQAPVTSPPGQAPVSSPAGQAPVSSPAGQTVAALAKPPVAAAVTTPVAPRPAGLATPALAAQAVAAPVEAPANPFATTPAPAPEARTETAVLGAAPAAPKAKPTRKPAAKPAAKPAKKPKKKSAGSLMEVPDEGVDANLYKY